MGAHHLREAQSSDLDDDQAPSGGPTKRKKKPVETARDPAEIRDFMESVGGLNIIRQSELSCPSVGSGLRCWGLVCDLNVAHPLPFYGARGPCFLWRVELILSCGAHSFVWRSFFRVAGGPFACTRRTLFKGASLMTATPPRGTPIGLRLRPVG